MRNLEKNNVILSAPNKQTSGYVYFRYWDKKSAVKRGFTICGLIYTAGILSIVNPVFHFILPPVWVIVGPYAGVAVYRWYADSIELKKGLGTCPFCNHETVIFPYGEPENFVAACTECREDMKGHAVKAS